MADTTLGRHHCRHPQADTPQVDTLQADTPRQTQPEMATAADGRHPTGMHSCCIVVIEKNLHSLYLQNFVPKGSKITYLVMNGDVFLRRILFVVEKVLVTFSLKLPCVLIQGTMHLVWYFFT